jgi:SNF2 family DNA or RNA helicase
MLREEQIDLRRQRARTAQFEIVNCGKNRIFSTFRVRNPASGGEYEVVIRSFEVGDNHCSCPDFRVNTLGTCKHIEAVLEQLRHTIPDHLRKRKAPVTHPEIYLRYKEQLQLALLLPPRRSDLLQQLADNFFTPEGLWCGERRFKELLAAIEQVPEQILVRSDALDYIDREIERDEMLAKEQQWLALLEADRLPWTLLRVPLYDYQLRGAIFLACRGRCILGDDMGLGKTVQALAAIEILARERGARRVLVVAPASVKYQWEAEIHRLTDRSVQVVEGDAQERRSLYSSEVFYLLVNYEQVVRDYSALNAWKPDVVILDEAQRIKNWEAKTTQAVKKLQSRYAFVLTGTPIENRLEELYSIVQFVDQHRFGPAFQFLHDHRIVDDKGRLKGYRNLEALREKLAPIFLRRTRAEVLRQLPPRTESIRYVELSDAQRTAYDAQRRTLAQLLQKKHLTELDRKRILSCLTHMRSICDSLFLYDPSQRISPKLDEFAELVPELVGASDSQEGHKLIVFSQWEQMIAEAAHVLSRLQIGHVVLHGGLSGPQRRDVLERFQKDPRCRVFLSTDAGGTGLNLQVADTVLNLELPWNPAVLEQRIARVHRMGQDRPVRVIHFITRYTIEERILEVLRHKRDLFIQFFEQDSNEIAFSAFDTSGFLDTVRELIHEPAPQPAVQAAAASSAANPRGSVTDAPPSLWQALAQMLEASAATLSDPTLRRATLDASSERLLRHALLRLLDVLQSPTSPPVNSATPNGIMD